MIEPYDPRCIIEDGEELAHCRHFNKGGICCHCDTAGDTTPDKTGGQNPKPPGQEPMDTTGDTRRPSYMDDPEVRAFGKAVAKYDSPTVERVRAALSDGEFEQYLAGLGHRHVRLDANARHFIARHVAKTLDGGAQDTTGDHAALLAEADEFADPTTKFPNHAHHLVRRLAQALRNTEAERDAYLTRCSEWAEVTREAEQRLAEVERHVCPPPEATAEDVWRANERAETAEAKVEALREALFHYHDTGNQTCPCGARPDDLNAFPHVIGCPVGDALSALEEE